MALPYRLSATLFIASAWFFGCVGDSASPGADAGIDGTMNDASMVDAKSDAAACEGGTLCGATCVATQTDPLNCGGCNRKCNVIDGGALPCISGQCGDTIVDVGLGLHHACAVLLDGDVWCWGDNFRGQLGVPRTTMSSPTPVHVDISNVMRVAAGFDSTCAVKTDNSVWCWGINTTGQLGHPSGGGSPVDDTNCTGNCNATPQKVGGLAPSDEIFLMDNAACARSLTGTVSCWGLETCGNLGQPDAGAQNLIPTQVQGVSGVAHLQNSSSSTLTECVLLDGGTPECWGDNGLGESGHTPEPTPPICFFTGGIALPSPVTGLTNVTSVCTSVAEFTCATSQGTVSCWGSNTFGTVVPGVSDGNAHPSPTAIALGSSAKALKVVCGAVDACALLDDGTVHCWGVNTSGQFGSGSLSDGGEVGPTQASVTNVVNVYAGGAFTGALLSDGSLALWGFNQSGELGHAPGAGGDTPCNSWYCDPAPSVVTGIP